MGHILSTVKAIEDQRFGPLPKDGRVCVKSKFVRIGHWAFLLTPTGLIQTNEGIHKNIALAGTDGSNAAIRAMLAFGLITQEDVDQHERPAVMRQKTRDIARAAITSLEDLERGGIRLTPKQKAQLAEMREITVKNLKSYKLPSWMRKQVEKALAKDSTND